MRYIYGKEFKDEQIDGFKKSVQGSIFFLLLCVDPETKKDYPDIDVEKTFRSTQFKLAGANELLGYPTELVTVMSLIEAAKLELRKDDFDFKVYRKLVLDAGAEIARLCEKVG